MQPSADPPENGLWASFLDGLTRTSSPSLVIAGTFCSAILFWCMHTIDESFVLQNPSLFAESPSDPAFSAAEGLLAATRRESPPPVVVLLGDISVESARHLQTQISDGTRARFLSLSYPRQTLWESIALLGRLPKSERGVVVLQISAACLQVGRETLSKLVKHPRLPFRSRAFDFEVETAGLSHPGLSGNYFLDNQGFLVRRMMGFTVSHFVSSLSLDGQTEISIDAGDVSQEGWAEQNSKVLDRIIERIIHRSRLDLVIDASQLDETSRMVVTQRASSPTPTGRVTWFTDTADSICQVIDERLARQLPSEEAP